MKTRFFAFILLFQFVCSYSQTTLTNAQVYNYSVGDTVQYQVPNAMCGTKPPYSVQFIVLQKTTTVNHIDYIINQTIMDGCGGCAGLTWNSIGTYTMSINNADSLAKHQAIYSYSPCILSTSVYTDTNFVTTYGKVVNQRRFQNTSILGGCSVNYGQSNLIEGVGEFYTLSVNQNGDPCYYSKQMAYCHKVGEAPVGFRLNFTVGVREFANSEGISVYPNPVVNQKITVANLKSEKLIITLFSIDGKQIYETTTSNELIEIDSRFDAGLYLIKLKNLAGDILMKKIIIE